MVVSRSWGERDWKANFRMSRATFQCLCSERHPYIAHEDNQFWESVTVGKRVVVSLWRLAGNSEFYTLPHLFSIGR